MRRAFSDLGLCEAEALALLARLLAMLRALARHYLASSPALEQRLAAAWTELLAFDVQMTQQQRRWTLGPTAPGVFPPDFLINWLRDQLTHWAARLCDGAVPRLRQRLADLLWAAGPAHFPFGVLTPAGRKESDKPLEALAWASRLLRSAPDAAAAVLAHARTALDAAQPPVRSLPRAQAHAWLSWALLSSPCFQARARELLTELDPGQRAAAAFDGTQALRVEAGPGAGKTRAIGARAAHLLRSRVGSPGAPQTAMRAEDVHAVTFTRRAAADVQRRLCALGLPMPTVATLDSFMMTLLCELRRASGVGGRLRFLPLFPARPLGAPQPADATLSLQELLVTELKDGRAMEDKNFEEVSSQLLRDALLLYRAAGLLLRAPPSDELLQQLSARVSKWARPLRESTHKTCPLLLPNVNRSPMLVHLRTALTALSTHMQQNDDCVSLDFDKEVLALALLRGARGGMNELPAWTQSEAARRAAAAWLRAASACHYIIDEFQDTSPSQLAVFAALAGGERLTVVGDCDQAIYGFRGASFESTLQMLRGSCASIAAEPHQMVVNYRSTPAIVAATVAVIRPNHSQSGGAKRLTAHRPQGYPVYTVGVMTAAEEHEHVLRSARRWHSEARVPFHHMAVLFRTTKQRDAFAKYLSQPAVSFTGFRLTAEAGGERAAAPEQGCMAVGTIHSVKGQEWEIVFVVGACDPTRPPRSAADDADEWRRVLYVALSRARSLLHVTHLEASEKERPMLESLRETDEEHLEQRRASDACWAAEPLSLEVLTGGRALD